MTKSESYQLPMDSPEAIRTDLLETFSYTGNPQIIRYTTNEFSAVCPFSGLPDLASIIIEYVPDMLCLELKSLKLYLVSYRTVGMFQEHITNKLFDDLWRTVKPKWLQLTTQYATRGGIDAECIMVRGDSSFRNQISGI